MTYLQSNLLEAVAYDEAEHVLSAKFRDGAATVLYEDVPQEVYDSLVFSHSVGEYFRTRIDGCYRARWA